MKNTKFTNFSNLSFKIMICFYVITICCKYKLTNKLLTQRGLPFSSPWESLKARKIIKNLMKNEENSTIFKNLLIL